MSFDPVTVSDVIWKEKQHPGGQSSRPGTVSSSQEPVEDVCVSQTLSPPQTETDTEGDTQKRQLTAPRGQCRSVHQVQEGPSHNITTAVTRWLHPYI